MTRLNFSNPLFKTVKLLGSVSHAGDDSPRIHQLCSSQGRRTATGVKALPRQALLGFSSSMVSSIEQQRSLWGNLPGGRPILALMGAINDIPLRSVTERLAAPDLFDSSHDSM